MSNIAILTRFPSRFDAICMTGAFRFVKPAILQSLPGGYHFSIRRGKLAAAQMIGNALPPEFIRWHAEVIRKEFCP
ncbi:MAG: hypothetical protein M2R45_02994 [Verrucomicrobia subdivision 3 bacterium]|nr:hypothetical protein [Limisphaerales bacterium]MCS1416520.1 hypothetical protein [Limisphaerales bacterium]